MRNFISNRKDDFRQIKLNGLLSSKPRTCRYVWAGKTYIRRRLIARSIPRRFGERERNYAKTGLIKPLPPKGREKKRGQKRENPLLQIALHSFSSPVSTHYTKSLARVHQQQRFSGREDGWVARCPPRAMAWPAPKSERERARGPGALRASRTIAPAQKERERSARKWKAARRWQPLYESGGGSTAACVWERAEEEGSSREADVQGRGRRNRFYVPELARSRSLSRANANAPRIYIYTRVYAYTHARILATPLLSIYFYSCFRRVSVYVTSEW